MAASKRGDLATVLSARIAGDHEQSADAAKCGDDFLDHPIGEIFLLRIAHIGEGHYRDRRLVGQGKCWSAFSQRPLGCFLSGGEPHSVDPYRSSNVFEALFAQIVERSRRPATSS